MTWQAAFADKLHFNSRPSARGDKAAASTMAGLSSYFNSRPSARGDIRTSSVRWPTSSNFNSRPSARGDEKRAYKRTYARISIHAPPRGATGSSVNDGWTIKHFNSRPSARGDGHPHGATGNAEISIHAPPRGATEAVGMVREKMVFQFTPLREGRQTRNQGDFRREHFNSRPSARGDRHPRLAGEHRPISIHAPPRGATAAARVGILHIRADFNSRPSARGDSRAASGQQSQQISIHAPPRGATHTEK